MALLYTHTTLVPGKLELLAEWLPAQPWFSGDASKLDLVAEYRFDDPEGEVGLNGLLVTAGDSTVYNVPLTYRGAALEQGEQFLVGKMEHGVLGPRWASEAIGDPVFRAVLAQTITQGGAGAEELVHDGTGNVESRTRLVQLRGSGEPGAPIPEMWAAEVTRDGVSSVASTGLVKLSVVHVPTAALAPGAGVQTLTATWPGQETPAVIATLA